jgi:hypothetical protein
MDFQGCCRICHQEGSGNRGGLNLNAIRHYLVYADDVNTLNGTIYSVKKNKETLIVSSKEISLEVKAEKSKYMIMFQ